MGGVYTPLARLHTRLLQQGRHHILLNICMYLNVIGLLIECRLCQHVDQAIVRP